MPDLYYQEQGKGYPIVLLHGFCETHEIWRAIAQKLSDRYRLIMPDLPGFGRSVLTRSNFTLSDIAEDIMHWLNQLGIGQAIVIGHSLGGYITLAMAEGHIGELAGFGLFNSSAYADGPEKKANRDKLIEFIRREGVAPFIKTFIPSLFYVEKADAYAAVIDRLRELGQRTPPETVTGYAAAMKTRPDRSDLLMANPERVLLIAGEHDQNVPLEQSRQMGAMLDARHVHILPDTAHMGMYEQPDLSAGAIESFAADVLGHAQKQ